MDITTDTARLLTQVGVMAALRGDTIDARTVLEGLQQFRHKSPAPRIGLAIAFMNEGRHQSAIEVLEEALAKCDKCEFPRVLLALACRLSGYHTRGRELCEQVLADGSDDSAVELADMLLALPAGNLAHQQTVA